MQKQCRSFLEETAARNLFPADHTSVREQTRKSSFRPLLGGGLFLVQGGANRDSGVGIDGAVAFFDVADDAVFVDDNVSALGPLERLALNAVGFEDAVGSKHFVIHVAEKRKRDVDLFGEGRVGGGAVNAHAKNFRVRGVDLSRGDSSLDRLKLFRSTAGKGQDVNGKKDIFLAAEVAELNGRALIAYQSEVWSGITDFQ